MKAQVGLRHEMKRVGRLVNEPTTSKRIRLTSTPTTVVRCTQRLRSRRERIDESVS